MREQTEKSKEGVCGLCGHSLENNVHGFDQNDALEGGKLAHHGTCTYCRKCNPGIFRKKKRPRLSKAAWDRWPEEERVAALIYFGINREDLDKYAGRPWNELPTWLHERWAREVKG